MPSRRQCLLAPAAARLVGLFGGTAVAGLAGCAGFGGPPVITLGEAELSALVARAFPMQRRLLELLEVQLSAPRLRLLPERNRLALDLALQTRERLLGASATGQLRFDSALRWEPGDASLRLNQVRVQQLELAPGALAALPAAPSAASANGADSPARRLGRALAERVLEDLAIYRLSAERQASLRQLGLQPGAVTVTARGVELTLARGG